MNAIIRVLFLNATRILYMKIIQLYLFVSGTVLDLPYRFIADGDHVEMERNENFEFKDMLAAAAGVAAVAADIAEAAGLLDECCNIL